MTQEEATAIFNSELGQQLDSFYEIALPDKSYQVCIRHQEAIDICNQFNLPEDAITEWFLEQSGKDLPIARTF